MRSLRSGLSLFLVVALAVAGGYWVAAHGQGDVTPRQIAAVEDLSAVFKHVGKTVEPSVVNITVRKKADAGPAMDDQMRQFLHDHGIDAPQQQPQEEIGMGSGVIMQVDGDTGYILTNNHVAGGAEHLEITLSDGRVIHNGSIKVLGTDPKSDLAVVKITADHLTAATWGDSNDLEKGDWVMAFGSPFGYVGSMTHGIVSALDRGGTGILPQDGYEDFIQVDAPINPGNSGGPLVNIHGEVVGINTAIATRSGGFQGIGFAIPSNLAKFVYTELKDNGQVVRGWLGVEITDLQKDSGMADSFHYKGDSGTLIVQTFHDTPAFGILKHGDIVEAVNDHPVDSELHFRNMIAETEPGKTVTLKIWRDDKEQSVDVKVGSQPANMASAAESGDSENSGSAENPEKTTAQALGVHLRTLDQDAAQRLGLDNAGGALVTDVDQDSVAATAGLTPGMVIREVNGKNVKTAQQAATALKAADVKTGIRLYIATQDGTAYLFMQNN